MTHLFDQIEKDLKNTAPWLVSDIVLMRNESSPGVYVSFRVPLHIPLNIDPVPTPQELEDWWKNIREIMQEVNNAHEKK